MSYHIMTKEFIDQVANDYGAAPHLPAHPSYRAFINETVSLFCDIPTRTGLKVYFLPGKPHLNFEEIRSIANESGVCKVFTGSDNLPADHPLARVSGYHSQTINSLARAVHDCYGHLANDLAFDFDGEMECYRIERKLYSSIALPAMYSEAIGQLCWYFSRGDFLATQKACIIPIRDVDL
jgi:hypothetical protein